MYSASDRKQTAATTFWIWTSFSWSSLDTFLFTGHWPWLFKSRLHTDIAKVGQMNLDALTRLKSVVKWHQTTCNGRWVGGCWWLVPHQNCKKRGNGCIWSYWLFQLHHQQPPSHPPLMTDAILLQISIVSENQHSSDRLSNGHTTGITHITVQLRVRRREHCIPYTVSVSANITMHDKHCNSV